MCMKRVIFVSILIGCLIFVYAANLDVEIIRQINGNRIKSLDDFFIATSFSAEYIHFIIPLSVLICGWYRKDKTVKNKGLFLLIVLIINGFLSFLLKNTFDRVRPFAVLDFVEKISVGGSSSFPSGHTMTAVTLAFAIYLLFKNRYLNIFFIVWAFLVGYSRIHCGVHYFTDVLAGAIFGMIATYFFYLLCKKKNWLL